MKIPLIWLKDYVEIEKSPREVADSFTKIGLMLDKPVGEDQVLDLEQRLNRSDLLSILGCARDYAVFENLKLKAPKIKLNKTLPADLKSKIEIKVNTPAVRRFNTRVFKGIKVAPSPNWLSERLRLYGIDSINNIVDISNFVMVEYGQTTHAQDIAKLKGKDITIRNAKAGEKIVTLLGTEIELDNDTFVLTSGGIPTVIGGIVGGKATGVTETTTDIVLDAGNYDPKVIRKNSRKLKIFNESVSHNDKLIDPRLCEIALNRATDLILDLAGGTVYENDDYYPSPVVPQSLSLHLDRLKLISGQDLSLKSVKSTLQKLGYAVTEENSRAITVEVPYYRTDIEVEDDLVSDILRMSDYNTIPSTSLRTPIPPDITSPLYRFEDKLKDYMLAVGAHEHITPVLVKTDEDKKRVKLENALSEDQNALRMSALETLPLVTNTYRKHKLTVPIVFEIGKSFLRQEYQELRELAVIDQTDIRTTLSSLMQALGIKYRLKREENAVTVVAGTSHLGYLHSTSFILYTNALMTLARPYPTIIANFRPETSIDLSLSLSSPISFDLIEDCIKKSSPDLSKLEVREERQTQPGIKTLLVRLTWEKLENPDQARKNIVSALEKIGVSSRSK